MPSGLIAITPNVTLPCRSQKYIYIVTMPIFPVQGRNVSKKGTFSLGTGDTKGGGNKKDPLKSLVPVSRAAFSAWRKIHEPHHQWK